MICLWLCNLLFMFKQKEHFFNQAGDEFTQLKREGMNCLFERKFPYGGKQYEVVILKEKGESEIKQNGKVYKYPPKEVYPGASHWGVYGWTLLSLDEAEKKFADLVG